MVNQRLCTCPKCGWVSMAISREFAQAEVDSFNNMPQEKRDAGWGDYDESGKVIPGSSTPATIDRYVCMLCGGSSFREYKEGDCPVGCTINSVIWEP